MQEQFALNEPIAPLSKSQSDPNNITIDNIHVSKKAVENNIYSAVPNKRTGTFIFLKQKFLLVRSFLSGTLIN